MRPSEIDTGRMKALSETMSGQMDELRQTLTELVVQQANRDQNREAQRAAREVEEGETRKRRETLLFRYLLGPLVAAGVAGGGVSAYRGLNTDAAPVESVRESVELEADALGEAVEENAKDIEHVGHVLEEMGEDIEDLKESQFEFVDYLGRKIDTIDRRARRVEEPESMRRRRNRE